MEQPTESMSQMVSILTAKTHLKKGDRLSKEDFEIREIPKQQWDLQENNPYIVEGKILTQDIPKGGPITKTMYAAEDIVNNKKRYVEHLFLDGVVPATLDADQMNHAYVDILLFKEEDYDQVVVKKTAIKAVSGNKVGFELEYPDILKLKEAATEGYLYLTFYLNKEQTEEIEPIHYYKLPYYKQYTEEGE